MINALEARKQISSADHPKTKSLLLEAESKIFKAINEGRSYTDRIYYDAKLPKDIYEEVEFQLLSNDYTIEACKEDHWFQIHW